MCFPFAVCAKHRPCGGTLRIRALHGNRTHGHIRSNPKVAVRRGDKLAEERHDIREARFAAESRYVRRAARARIRRGLAGKKVFAMRD